MTKHDILNELQHILNALYRAKQCSTQQIVLNHINEAEIVVGRIADKLVPDVAKMKAGKNGS